MLSKNAQAGFVDVILPVAIIGVIAMMILPLPAFLLDCMLMLNISFAVLLIISVVYLKEPEKFTALPSMLLFATLLRLSLNISTTRYILSTGDAPYIVSAFSSFVVQGNLVVGVVMFAIITIVQFLVIAKGAERVAEVSARFSLDAMPGRQMSIDADIRSGALSIAEAKNKRRELQTESRLYAALDGAMRFIKGDAIAGILITIVNIVAGIIVGFSIFSLSFGESVSKFTFYTIGDGLVSQIPALLVSVAAGITITRVSDQKGNLVGRDIFSQISAEPRAISLTSLVLFLLSFVPGMPMGLFLITSVLLFGVSYKLIASKKLIERASAPVSIFTPKIFSGVSLKISKKAALRIAEENSLSSSLQSMRQEIFNNSGVIIPDLQYEEYLSKNDLSLSLQLPGMTAVIIEEETLNIEDSKSFSEALVSKIENLAIKNLDIFIDDRTTRHLFEIHAPLSEALINTLVPEKISVTALTRLLRDLVRDEISIREFQVILQAVSEYFYLREEENSQNRARNSEIDANDNTKNYISNLGLYSWVRIALKNEIVKKIGSDPSCFCLTKELEEKISSSLYFSKEGTKILREKIEGKLKTLIKSNNNLTILCSSLVRLTLAECFRDLKKIKFIALEELPAEYEFENVSSFKI